VIPVSPSPKFLLDSSVISEAARVRPDPAIVAGIEVHAGETAITAPVWPARERARLSKAGRRPPFVDGQIAAIAATNGLVLVTANPKDFTVFRGLEVTDWRSGKRGPARPG